MKNMSVKRVISLCAAALISSFAYGNPGGGASLTVTTEALPTGTERVAYSHQLSATGGTAPLKWSIPGSELGAMTNETSTFATVGEAMGWRDDDNRWSLDLPFAFPFYGKSYRKVYVNSNGYVSFDENINSASFEDYVFSDNPVIAVLWRDLMFSDEGEDIYVESNSTSVTICWVARYWSWGEDELVHASITLADNGTITLRYGDGNDLGGFVGISAGDGKRALILCPDSYDSLDNAPDFVIRGGGIGNGLVVSETGIVSGMPETAGEMSFTAQVTDANGQRADRKLTLTVNENPNRRPRISATLPGETEFSMQPGGIHFEISAFDPDGSPLTYTWLIDGEVVGSNAASYEWMASISDDPDEPRLHVIECVVSDGFWTQEVRARWTVCVMRHWYVDANAAENGDGSESAPHINLDDVASNAGLGDIVHVAAGNYYCGNGFHAGVTIIATDGPENTVMRGSPQVYSGSDEPLSSIIGFTLRGATVNNFAISNCVLTAEANGETSRAGGCRLEDCIATGNKDMDGPLFENCELIRCTVAGNQFRSGYDYAYALGEGCTVTDSIVWDNLTPEGEAANYNPGTYGIWDPTLGEPAELPCVTFTNSCTTPLSTNGVQIITSDPRLANPAEGDVRLRVGSPCIDAQGNQTMGRNMGAPVDGYLVTVEVKGYGAVSPTSAFFETTDSSATFTVQSLGRDFAGYSYNGTFATAEESFTLSNVAADGVITATFLPKTFYVDRENGLDQGKGSSWTNAMTEICSAIAETKPCDIILVKPGVYSHIDVYNDWGLLIQSVAGPEQTVIDGDGSSCCAYLGEGDSRRTTLSGFTLRNGYAKDRVYGQGYGPYGGGVYGGIITNCVVTNCAVNSEYSMAQGGGVYNTKATDCIIVGNRCSTGAYAAGAFGGGAFGSTLTNCVLTGNICDGYNDARGGGAYMCDLTGCTVTNNTLASISVDRMSGSGLYWCETDTATVVSGNTAIIDNEPVEGVPEKNGPENNPPEEEKTATETTPEPVPYEWLDTFPGLKAANGGDYEQMGNADSPGASGTGKLKADGSKIKVWEDYVMGTDPTTDNVLTALIEVVDGNPVVTWTPDLGAARVYKVFGAADLAGPWTDVTSLADKSAYRFFKVTVDLP